LDRKKEIKIIKGRKHVKYRGQEWTNAGNADD
jgi:hypothetical protein